MELVFNLVFRILGNRKDLEKVQSVHFYDEIQEDNGEEALRQQDLRMINGELKHNYVMKTLTN